MKRPYVKGFLVNPYVITFLLLLLFSFLIFSCSDEDEVNAPTSSGATAEMIDFIRQSGFGESDIVLKNDVFIIDGDILWDRKDVEETMLSLDGKINNGGRTEHWRGNLVGDQYVTNIKFYIDPSVPESWKTAVRGAIDQWNAVEGTKLFMSEVTSSGQANTRIFTGYSSQNWVARAYLPSYRGRPGQSIEINTKYNRLNSGLKLFTIVHEMGHVFGLYHTDQTQGIFITGTPQVDANSVMNSYVLPWAGFTPGDLLAVQLIYPE